MLRLPPGLPAGYARASFSSSFSRRWLRGRADLRRRAASDSDDAWSSPHPHLGPMGFPKSTSPVATPSSHRRSCPLFLFLRSTRPFFIDLDLIATPFWIRLLRHYSTLTNTGMATHSCELPTVMK